MSRAQSTSSPPSTAAAAGRDADAAPPTPPPHPPPPSPAPRARSLWLGAEFGFFFIIAPAVYAAFVHNPGWMFPALWAWAGACLLVLLLSKTNEQYRHRNLLHPRGVLLVWKRVLWRFAALAPPITGAFALIDHFLFTEEVWLFSLPRERTGLWIAIMFLYPVFSVYPQELIWRGFFFHRYHPIFTPSRGAWQLVWISSFAFAWAHIMFPSPWVAMSMTFVGGLLFADTYRRSQSLLAASLEHALYGCLIFTIGMGRFFYSGAVQ